MVVEADDIEKAMMSLCVLEQELFDGGFGGMGYAWEVELTLLAQPIRETRHGGKGMRNSMNVEARISVHGRDRDPSN